MHRQIGFTLIEVMVVVVIIAILSAIAIPQYSDYVTRSKITEALSGLSDMRVRMEQYFQDRRTYVGACAANTVAALPPNTSNFTFSCPTNPTATTYTVRATGVGSMNGFVYTVNQANVRSTTGVPNGWTASASCWVTKKDGSC